MRPDDPFVLTGTPAPNEPPPRPTSGNPRGLAFPVLPFARELARQAPVKPIPGPVMFGFTRLQPPPAATPEPPPRPDRTQRRGPSPRLQALRNGVIIKTANHGANLLRQVGQGLITPAQAQTNFKALTDRPDFSPKAITQLRRDFTTGLMKTARRGQNRPSAQTAPRPNNAVPRPNLDDQALHVASQGASGLNIGLARLFGLPVDTPTFVLNLLSLGLKAASGVDIGQIERPFLGSEQLQDFLTDAGTIAPPGDDRTGQIARRIGESVGGNLIPAAGTVAGSARAARQFGKTAIPLLRQIARNPGKTLAAELGASVAGGTGAAIANQIAPGSDLADFAGETIGTLLGVSPAVTLARTAQRVARRNAARQNTASTKPEVPENGVPRVGRPLKRDVVELPIQDLIHTHPVPRPEVPPNHIDDLATSIRKSGFDLGSAIGVFRMPDDKLILFAGNHRLAAMRQLGEKSIPARVIDWENAPHAFRVGYKTEFPDTFHGYSID